MTLWCNRLVICPVLSGNGLHHSKRNQISLNSILLFVFKEEKIFSFLLHAYKLIPRYFPILRSILGMEWNGFHGFYNFGSRNRSMNKSCRKWCSFQIVWAETILSEELNLVSVELTAGYRQNCVFSLKCFKTPRCVDISIKLFCWDLHF